jgi:sugar lactone lactonase YvrE
MMEIDGKLIKPLAQKSLAYPSGLVISNDDKNLYVCETCKNRVLRFVLAGPSIHYSVLH